MSRVSTAWVVSEVPASTTNPTVAVINPRAMAAVAARRTSSSRSASRIIFAYPGEGRSIIDGLGGRSEIDDTIGRRRYQRVMSRDDQCQR